LRLFTRRLIEPIPPKLQKLQLKLDQPLYEKHHSILNQPPPKTTSLVATSLIPLVSLHTSPPSQNLEIPSPIVSLLRKLYEIRVRTLRKLFAHRSSVYTSIRKKGFAVMQEVVAIY
jgi:hypothetical protein